MLNNNKIYKLAFLGDFGRSDVVAKNVLLSDGDGNSQLFQSHRERLGMAGPSYQSSYISGCGPAHTRLRKGS